MCQNKLQSHLQRHLYNFSSLSLIMRPYLHYHTKIRQNWVESCETAIFVDWIQNRLWSTIFQQFIGYNPLICLPNRWLPVCLSPMLHMSYLPLPLAFDFNDASIFTVNYSTQVHESGQWRWSAASLLSWSALPCFHFPWCPLTSNHPTLHSLLASFMEMLTISPH